MMGMIFNDGVVVVWGIGFCSGAFLWPLSGWLLPLRLFRGAGRSSSFGFGYVAI